MRSRLLCCGAAVLAAIVLTGAAAAQSSTQAFQPLKGGSAAPAATRIPVAVNLQDVTLEDALRDITTRAGLGLSYRPGIAGLDRRVTLRADVIPAADAMLRVVEGSGLELLVSPNGKALLLRAATPKSTTHGSIAGVVRDESGTPLTSADVRVAGTSYRGLTDGNGRFLIERIEPGVYAIEANRLGYLTAHRDSVIVSAEQRAVVDLELAVFAIPLSDVIVTPGHFGIAYETASRAQTLTREQIETLPQLGEDIYRAVNRLPGIGSNEMSAKFSVRGGDDESLLVLLDGLELYEPFHLKDFDGSLSILDVAAIGGVDLTTGGFSAEYGNRLTGVFDLHTTTRILPRPRSSIGISLSNARFMSQGSFAEGNGLWLFSARRGYLDILLKLIGEGENTDPRYYDALGKVVYQISPRHQVSVRVLRAGDTASLIDDDGGGELNSSYGSTYAWAGWSALLGRGVEVETMVSTGALDWNRDGLDRDVGEGFEIADTRDLRFFGIKQDWQAELSDRLVLKWGVEGRQITSEYDYFKRREVVRNVGGQLVTTWDSTRVLLDPDARQLGAYVAQRSRPWQPLTIETGLRWDQQSHTDEVQWSPRLNVALAADPRTTLRFAWGRYAQPQGLHQLHVQDGESEFGGAEKAVQIVGGIDRDFGRGYLGRIEGYIRKESDLRPRFRNLTSTIEPVAEVQGDRARINRSRGEAKGVELLLQHAMPKSSWGVSYAIARAEDFFADRRVPRPLEQRHTVYADYSIAPSPAWRLSASWQYHTGWPATPSGFSADTLANGNVTVSRNIGPYNSDRLPSYQRMDLRVTRAFDIGRGRLALFLDVFNLLNRKNPQSFEYSITLNRNQLSVRRTYEPLLPRLPTVGLTWEF